MVSPFLYFLEFLDMKELGRKIFFQST
ncbi:hypothetical protein RDI58_007026 [Solanum bulbocastanum]|uniref:Uncharacterized protein n=1 Tax=Solanum bulbocastanum TaxID=147425 RepID=A0AAN8YLQ8_SOLBU